MPMMPSEWANLCFDAAAVTSRAHFSTMHGPIDAWFRQTPGHDGIFGTTAFTAQPSRDRAEWLVVSDEPSPGLRSRIPVERRILFLGEPPEIKSYPPSYLNQFGVVVGPVSLPGYRGSQVHQQPALPWHYGLNRAFTWQEFCADKPKSRAISVFCTDKRLTAQQERRLRFVEELKRRFGDLVHHYGNGFEPIDEKADGLAPYRMTVVLENNTRDEFWTEKLADAYLGHCFPIYAGGRIGRRDFDPRARLDIDVSDIDASLRDVERLIGTFDFAAFEDTIRDQRRKVMLDHNLFAVADRLIRARRHRKGLLPRAQKIRQSYDRFRK
jgi:hypothetical protein